MINIGMPSQSNTPSHDVADAPIGVFDSGIGGLTVVEALRRVLPLERILYIGDTARVPYGGKSAETVIRYSREISEHLIGEGAKLIVVACNTASALAVSILAPMIDVPLIGVLEPGASAAVKATKNKRIGVIGTKATIGSFAYEKAIRTLDSEITVSSAACPLLVPLIEEGLYEDDVTSVILRRYLEPMLANGIDTLVLGCTHYPLLKRTIQLICGPGVTLVDSAENCALAVRELLASQTHHRDIPRSIHLDTPRLDIVLTDSSEGFLRVAEKSLDLTIDSLSFRQIGK